ncbi:MAG: cobalt ECF transporter T component CbiQ [Candidatus Atribacteria bacterium]|nr:cobalt ECF transporter T component CbiQ [Candidatus Atribacteria bacterium]
MLIDNYAYTNKLINVHPGEKLLFSLTSMAVGFVPNIYVDLVIILMMGVVLVWKAGIPTKVYLKVLVLPLSFLLPSIFVLMINVVSTESQALWGFSVFHVRVGVTAASIKVAGLLFLRAMALISCLFFLSLTTPMIDLIMVLEKLKVPFIILELMQLVYHFLFVFMEMTYRIYISQSSRLGYITPKAGINSLGRLVTSLFIKTYQDSESLYVALEARGYDGELRVLNKNIPVSKSNLFCILSTELLLLLVALVTQGGMR